MDDIYIEPPHYPDRRKGIYKEIKSWKDYELRNNIAYEMAIRNKKNIRSLEEYKNLLYEIILPHTDFEIEIRELLNLNKTILLAYKEYGENIYFKSFGNNCNQQISSAIYNLLDNLHQKGFTIEAINFYISMTLISQIKIFKELTHIQIYYKLQDINNKYYDLNTYFIFKLGSSKIESSISSKYIEDYRNKIYNVKLEDDGLYAYERKWENRKLNLKKYAQINPATHFKSEINLQYKLSMSRPLMRRPYRHNHISISINTNKSIDAITEEVKLIVESLYEEKKSKSEKQKKSQHQLNKKIFKQKLMSPKNKALFKLKYIMQNYKPSNSSNADLHHVVANEIDRPKDSNDDNHQFFIKALYIYDCYQIWKRHRTELKKYYSSEKFKSEELPYKYFINELHQKFWKNKNSYGDHQAKKYLRAFERYVEGYSHTEKKKYIKDCNNRDKLRNKNYKRYLETNDEDEFRQNNLNLKHPQEKEPKYFSLI